MKTNKLFNVPEIFCFEFDCCTDFGDYWIHGHLNAQLLVESFYVTRLGTEIALSTLSEPLQQQILQRLSSGVARHIRFYRYELEAYLADERAGA